MAKAKNASKSKGAKATKKAGKKSTAKKGQPFDGSHLEKAGFAKASSAAGATTYTKGQKRVEVSSAPGDGGPVEHVKYFDEAHPSHPNPVFHTNAGVKPTGPYFDEFVK